MNWTGGTRARNNKSSSNTTRLQKRYFAKVRAQNSAPLAHAGSSFNLSNDNTLLPAKRKKSRIPDLDIIVSKDGSQFRGSLKKRKLLDSSENLPGGTRTGTPASPAQSFRNSSRRVSELKTKKQILLEKDDWVCTTLSRPLVLKHHDGGSVNLGPTKRTMPELSSHHEQLLNRIDSDIAGGGPESCGNESQEPGYPHNPLPKNLSDGGYVQIEDTMLFDLEGRSGGYGTPSPFRRIPTRSPGIFGRKYQAESLWEGPENVVCNINRWDAHRNRYGTDGPLSSPLARYSQNINNRRLSIPTDLFGDKTDPERDIIDEIDFVATDIASSSPSTILSTAYVRPELRHSPLPRVALPPVIAQNQGHQRQYQTPIQHKTTNKSGGGGLNSLLGENIETTQNMSLVAYASSDASSAQGEGGDWVLGLNTSPTCRGFGGTGRISTQECQDDWEKFLKNRAISKVKATKINQDLKSGDVQRHLGEIGVWERHPGPENLGEGDIDYNEEDCNQGNRSEDSSRRLSSTDIPNPRESSDPPPEGSFPLSGGGNEEGPLKDFVQGLQDESSTGHTIGCGTYPHKVHDVNQHSDSLALNLGAMRGRSVEPVEAKASSGEKPGIVLDLDKDEDSAWRIFVFDGLDGGAEGEVDEDLRSFKPLGSTSHLPPKSSLRSCQITSLSPEPESPSLPENPGPNGPPYSPSMAGATVGSGSALNPEASSSLTNSSPPQRISKFFNSNPPSSPLASPVSTIPTRPYLSKSMVPIGWRGGSNLYSNKLEKRFSRDVVRRDEVAKKGEESNCHVEDGIEDIEDW